MTDARFPERWLLDRRINRLSDRDFPCFVYSLAWSVSNRTDGLIDERDFALIPHFNPQSVGALVAAELWEVVTFRGQNHWRIADFKTTQSGRDELEVLERARGGRPGEKAQATATRGRKVPGKVPGNIPGTCPRDCAGK